MTEVLIAPVMRAHPVKAGIEGSHDGAKEAREGEHHWHEELSELFRRIVRDRQEAQPNSCHCGQTINMSSPCM